MRINDYLFTPEDLEARRSTSEPIEVVPSDEDVAVFKALSENNATIIVALSKLIPYFDMTSGVKVAAMKELIEACLAPIDPEYAPNEWGLETVTNALAVVDHTKKFSEAFLRVAEFRNRIVYKHRTRKNRKVT